MEERPLKLKKGIPFWLDFFHKNAPLSCVDLFFIGNHDLIEFAAGFAATSTSYKHDEKEFLFNKIYFIHPVEHCNNHFLDEFRKNIFEEIKKLIETYQPGCDCDKAANYLMSRIIFTSPVSYESDDLFKLVSPIETNSAIFIINADSYQQIRSLSLPSSNHILSSSYIPSFENFESILMNNLLKITESISKLAVKNSSYFILHIQNSTPLEKSSVSLFNSIRNCSIISFLPFQNNSDIIKKLSEMFHKKDFKSMVDLIDKSELDILQKSIIKAQCLSLNNDFYEAYAHLSPHLKSILESGDSLTLLNTSWILALTGFKDDSVSFLRAAIRKGIRTEKTLALGLRISRNINAKTERDFILESLYKYYPSSLYAVEEKVLTCKTSEEYKEALKRIEEIVDGGFDGEGIQYYRLLSSYFALDKDIFLEFYQKASKEHPSKIDMAAFHAAIEANNRGFSVTALKILGSHNWSEGMLKLGVKTTISALKIVFIHIQKHSHSSEKLISDSIEIVLKYLYEHPLDNDIRLELIELLSPSNAGRWGVSFLSFICLRETEKYHMHGVPNIDNEVIEPIDPDIAMEYLTKYFESISNEGIPYILGVGDLSSLEFKHDVAQIYKTLRLISDSFLSNYSSDSKDLESLKMLLHFAILISRQCKGDDEDLEFLRDTSAQLTRIGDYQQARHFAAHILSLSKSNDTPLRRKKAWLNYADIYARCNNIIEALIGLACSKQCSSNFVNAIELFGYIYLKSRILRDVGLFEAARKTAEYGIEISQSFCGIKEQAVRRIKTFIIGLQVGSLSENTESDSFLDEADKLSSELIAISKIERESGQDIMPCASLLAKLYSINSKNTDLFDELKSVDELLSPEHRWLINAIAFKLVSFKEFEALYFRLMKAINKEDIGYDIRNLQHIARQLLSKKDNEFDYDELIFLHETLTDQSVSLVILTEKVKENYNVDYQMKKYIEYHIGKADKVVTQQNQGKLDELGRNLFITHKKITDTGVLEKDVFGYFVNAIKRMSDDFCLIALDNDELLSKIIIGRNLCSHNKEDSSIFDFQAFRKWKQEFPYKYGGMDIIDPAGLNIIEQTMKGIGITLGDIPDVANPLLIIPDVRLSSIPFNLFLTNEQIGGYNRPIALVPSLTWLHSSMSTIRMKTEKKISWMPQIDDENDALFVLYERMTPIINQHNIEIINRPLSKQNMSDCDITIIGAHGSLFDDNGLFSVISNGEEISVSQNDFAYAFRNSEIVVLFLCSGGKLDVNPFSASSVGVPHVLLQYGCRTVIASPWPIQPSIAEYWLPVFFDKYQSGLNAVESNYLANRAVASRINHPMAALAMHLYGDPYTKN